MRLGRRRRRVGAKSRLLTAGFVGGVLAGLVVWSVQMQRSKRDLFSRNRVRRLAALGHLGGGVASPETVRLLTEYLRWETNPGLRKRAERLVRRMNAQLV